MVFIKDVNKNKINSQLNNIMVNREDKNKEENEIKNSNKNKLEIKNLNEKNNEANVVKLSKNNNTLWIIRISILAFCLSLFLSLFSELILKTSNIFIAFLLLIVFMLLNIFSDMFGLAITSCQIETLKKDDMSEKLYLKCLKLIKSSDKVSSILCDVVGDICSILCGVSGTMIAMIITSSFDIISFSIFFAAVISSLIAGLTVFFKAIAKKYAIKNSLKLVKRSAKIIVFIKNTISSIFKGKNGNKELL